VVWVKIERYDNQDALPDVAEDSYLATYMDMTSDGLQKAFENRWIEEVTTTGATGNLNYTRTVPAGDWDYTNSQPAEGNTNYVMAEDVLTVKQGETVKVHVRGHNGSDDIRYCLFKAWLDWDIDYIFNSESGSDEVVWEYGTLNHGAAPYNDGGTTRTQFVTQGVDFTLNVPEDAKPGDSRLRFVACDAWFAGGLNATGGFNKGFALDIPVKIVGNNAHREPQKSYLDYRDQGEPEVIKTTGVDDITFNNNDANVAVTNNGDNTISFTNVEKAWIFTPAGQMVKFVGHAAGNVSIADLANGIYIVKMQNGQVIRSAKLLKK
jgi:hypothetical protein